MSQNLEEMKLPELRELAKQMGLRGTSTMRKPQLLATLQAARSGGQAPAGVTVRVPKPVKKAASAPEQPQSQTKPQSAASAPDSASASKPVFEPQSKSAAESKPATESASEQPEARVNRRSLRVPPIAHTEAISSMEGELQMPRVHERRAHRHVGEAAGSSLLDQLDLDSSEGMRTRHRGNERGNERVEIHRRGGRADSSVQEREEEAVRDLDDILASLPAQKNEEHGGDDRAFGRRRGLGRNDRIERNDRNDRNDRSDRGDRSDRNDRNDRNDRRSGNRRLRGRDLDDRRGEEQNDELVPVAGIVDVLDSYAFIRTSGYLPGPNDVYVSMGQVKKYGLRKGDAVQGTIRTPREGDRRNQRQKFVPLQAISSINGMSVDEAANRPQFAKLTPLYPQERLRQETTPNKLIGRIIDLVAPIGKGQRGLIVSPPKAGKTITLQAIANAITVNNPEVHLMVVLVDERPEEVTDMERTVQGEVISSTFDRPATDHTMVAELAIERAKRLVELGQDVVVLLDSMTRLARAYNIAAPASGRILSGGVDAQALYPPKKFFGAARNIENGGSLTIISTALVETGSKMDEVIFEEFKGTGNMELRLSRDLADKRMFPAVDINASGTRREELITSPQELPIIYRLRRLFGGLEPEQAYQALVPRLKKTPSNRDFLKALVQQSGVGSSSN